MPIIRILSFVRDSFSLTRWNTVLYTGGMYAISKKKGKIYGRIEAIGSDTLVSVGKGYCIIAIKGYSFPSNYSYDPTLS